jgi:hypothetical protein
VVRLESLHRLLVIGGPASEGSAQQLTPDWFGSPAAPSARQPKSWLSLSNPPVIRFERVFFALAAKLFYPIVVFIDTMTVNVRMLRKPFEQLARAAAGLPFGKIRVAQLGESQMMVSTKNPAFQFHYK